MKVRRGGRPNWRFAFVSAALLGTMAVTLVASWQLHVLTQSRAQAVEAMLGEYAHYVSRTFGEALLRHSYGTRMSVLNAPAAIPALSVSQPMPLDDFADHAERGLRVHGVMQDEWLGLLRFELATARLEGRGALARSDVAAAVDSIIRADLAAAGPADAEVQRTFVAGGEPMALWYAVQRTRAREPVAVFGFVASRRALAAVQADWVMRTVPLFPPVVTATARGARGRARRAGAHAAGGHDVAATTVASAGAIQAAATATAAEHGGTANHGMLSIDILDRDGSLLFRSPHRFESGAGGSFAVHAGGGGITVRSVLSPAFVASVVNAHAREPNRHYALLLPLVSLLLGTGAIVNLVRERELVRARRDFIAAVSHELRTPLAQVQIIAETLERGRERSPEERVRWLGVISREAYRMAGLVENILMFSHLERGSVRLERKPTELAALVTDVADTFSTFADARNSRISTDVPPGLIVDVDAAATRQILGNLIDNALKYGPNGQDVRIVATPATSGDDARQVVLAVHDQGPGVPPHLRAAIWEPFQRLSWSGGTAGGSGLGLAVVQSLVAQHGGTAAVDDGLDGGAVFRVTLPAVAAPVTVPGAYR